MLFWRRVTAAGVEASVEEVSTVEDLEVEVSMEEVSGVVSTAVALMRPLWLPDTLEAESVAGVGESALADRTFQIAFRTLLAQDPGSHHLGDHHPGNLCMMDDLIEP
jgi:hypothetical protein